MRPARQPSLSGFFPCWPSALLDFSSRKRLHVTEGANVQHVAGNCRRAVTVFTQRKPLELLVLLGGRHGYDFAGARDVDQAAAGADRRRVKLAVHTLLPVQFTGASVG